MASGGAMASGVATRSSGGATASGVATMSGSRSGRNGEWSGYEVERGAQRRVEWPRCPARGVAAMAGGVAAMAGGVAAMAGGVAMMSGWRTGHAPSRAGYCRIILSDG